MLAISIFAIAVCLPCTKAWSTCVQEFAYISPLPGGGLAVSPDGDMDTIGAIQFNIPVAYTPKMGYLNGGAYAGSTGGDRGEFRHFTGFLGGSVGESTRAYLSVLAASSHWSPNKFAFSGQILIVPETSKTPAVSVGAQDLFKSVDDETTPYVTATKSLAFRSHKVFLTLGYGGCKFENRVFGGLSYPLSDYFNIAGEYDGSQWNGGVTWKPGGRHGKITLLASYNGRTGVLAGVGATFRLTKSTK